MKPAIVAAIGLLCVLGILASFRGAAPAHDRAIAALWARHADCQKRLADLTAGGAVQIIASPPGAVSAYIDEAAWNAMTYREKVGVANLLYCAVMPRDGQVGVYIEGLHDGKIKADVVDGRYHDG